MQRHRRFQQISTVSINCIIHVCGCQNFQMSNLAQSIHKFSLLFVRSVKALPSKSVSRNVVQAGLSYTAGAELSSVACSTKTIPSQNPHE